MITDVKKLMDEMDTLLAELEKLPKGSLVTHKRKNDRCYYGHQFGSLTNEYSKNPLQAA